MWRVGERGEGREARERRKGRGGRERAVGGKGEEGRGGKGELDIGRRVLYSPPGTCLRKCSVALDFLGNQGLLNPQK